jgi:AcrR family transcriptional regulator
MALDRTADPSSTRELLIRTAERLFATHGLNGPSLRQICIEAGSANPSAIHYHFGTKDELVEAIFRSRTNYLSQRRQVLGLLLPEPDLRSVVTAHVLPLFELAELDDCHYLTFCEQVFVSQPTYENRRDASDFLASFHRFEEALRPHLTQLPGSARERRVAAASRNALHVAARRERLLRAGIEVLPLSIELNEHIDQLCAQLLAPTSPATERALADSPSRPRRKRTTARSGGPK